MVNRDIELPEMYTAAVVAAVVVVVGGVVVVVAVVVRVELVAVRTVT